MNAIRKWAGGFGTALLSLLLPNRTKRMLFLTSFFAQIKEGSEGVDAETLAKLNKAMSLVKREDSLNIGIQLNRAIWNGKSSKELCLDELHQRELTPMTLRHICTDVIKAMPGWLRYAPEPAIREDLVKLFGARMKVLET